MKLFSKQTNPWVKIGEVSNNNNGTSDGIYANYVIFERIRNNGLREYKKLKVCTYTVILKPLTLQSLLLCLFLLGCQDATPTCYECQRYTDGMVVDSYEKCTIDPAETLYLPMEYQTVNGRSVGVQASLPRTYSVCRRGTEIKLLR